jgi:hypothetical protein
MLTTEVNLSLTPQGPEGGTDNGEEEVEEGQEEEVSSPL